MYSLSCQSCQRCVKTIRVQSVAVDILKTAGHTEKRNTKIKKMYNNCQCWIIWQSI